MVETIQKHQELYHAKVAPGQPFVFSDAATVRDAVWQGDLRITIIDGPPSGYALRDPGNGKLVPGTSIGAGHYIKDVTTVDEFCAPADWTLSADYDALAGPAFLCKKTTVIKHHGRHGSVTVPAGFWVGCKYQRNLDVEQQRQRRATD